MNQKQFERELHKARALKSENPDYWAGYARGLRRRYHRENFGTDDEHALWMSMANDDDRSRSERGRGYRDGYISVETIATY